MSRNCVVVKVRDHGIEHPVRMQLCGGKPTDEEMEALHEFALELIRMDPDREKKRLVIRG